MQVLRWLLAPFLKRCGRVCGFRVLKAILVALLVWYVGSPAFEGSVGCRAVVILLMAFALIWVEGVGDRWAARLAPPAAPEPRAFAPHPEAATCPAIPPLPATPARR